MLLGYQVAGPLVREAYAEHDVRAKIAAALATVRPVQQQIEDSWNQFRAVPVELDYDKLRVQAAAAFFDEVIFRPATGRLRLGLGPSIPELWGRTILLAPALDLGQHLHWVCVPIDIPARFLPMECRGG